LKDSLINSGKQHNYWAFTELETMITSFNS